MRVWMDLSHRSSEATNATVLRTVGLDKALQLAGVDLVGPRGPAGGALGKPPGLTQVLHRKYWWDEATYRSVLELEPEVIISAPAVGNARAASKAAKRIGASLVVRIDDWYDLRHVPASSAPQWAMNEIAMGQVTNRADGAIAISTYLSEHLEQRGVRSLVVPPLFDPAPNPEASRSTSRLHLCYVGAVAAKDILAVKHLIAAVKDLDPLGQRVRVTVAGASAEVLRKRFGELPPAVHALGRVPHSQALNIVRDADYVVVQRSPYRRYARAGFPSKVAESLACGTAVMANISSDLDLYLIDGENAIILQDQTELSMRRGIERALSGETVLSHAEIADRAQGQFSPSAHSRRLANYLSELVKG